MGFSKTAVIYPNSRLLCEAISTRRIWGLRFTRLTQHVVVKSLLFGGQVHLFFHGQFFISFEFAKCRSCNMLTSNTRSQLSDCVQCGSVARLRFKIKESAGPSPVTIGTEVLYDPATQVLPGILRFWFTACFWFAFRQWLSHVVSLLRKKCCREFQPFPSMANPVAWHVFSSIATLSNKSISLIVCKI